MTGTITTRAGEGQRAPGGLHPFFGVQGAASTQNAGKSRRETAQERPLPYGLGLLPIGREFLDRIFSHVEDGDLDHDEVEAPLWRPSDREWVRKRIEKLRPMSEGRVRIVPQVVWDLAVLLQHPKHRRAAFKRFAHQVPADFLAMVSAVALLDSRGGMRALASRRATSILALGILLWLLSDRDPDGGEFGYVVRGLPYGVWCELLARFEDFGRAERVVPHVNTVWGSHRSGARYDRAENGYMAALRQAGVIKTKQPPWWTVPAGRRGVPYFNDKGDKECWAFVEIRLRIRPSGAQSLALGPPDVCVQLPPLAPPPTEFPDDVVANDTPQWLFVPPEPQLHLSTLAHARREAPSVERTLPTSAPAGAEPDENVARAREAADLVRRFANARAVATPGRRDHALLTPPVPATEAATDEEKARAREAMERVRSLAARGGSLDAKPPPKPG